MKDSGDFKFEKDWEQKAVGGNAAWVRARAADGYKFIDIGLDNSANRSPFYAAERIALSRTGAKVMGPNRCAAAAAKDGAEPSKRPPAKGRYGRRK